MRKPVTYTKKHCQGCHKERSIAGGGDYCAPCEKHFADPKTQALIANGLSKAGFQAWEAA